LRQSRGGRSSVQVNFEGNEVILFNKVLNYYEVYASYNSQEA
jgi:hypothetical protein